MRLFVLAALLALASCGQPQSAGYPPEIELNFRNACEAQSPPDGVCSCVWQRIVAEVPPEDFIALERLPMTERLEHPLTEQINNFALACTPEPAIPAGGEPQAAP